MVQLWILSRVYPSRAPVVRSTHCARQDHSDGAPPLKNRTENGAHIAAPHPPPAPRCTSSGSSSTRPSLPRPSADSCVRRCLRSSRPTFLPSAFLLPPSFRPVTRTSPPTQTARGAAQQGIAADGRHGEVVARRSVVLVAPAAECQYVRRRIQIVRYGQVSNSGRSGRLELARS